MKYPKIIHIITDLDGFGGTEATLLRYLVGSNIPRECHLVIVLKSIGDGDTLGAQMVAAGISVIALNQKRGTMALSAFLRLYRESKNFCPDVISGWLYHPSLLASILVLFLKRPAVVIWHIRSLVCERFLHAPNRFVVQRILSAIARIANPILVSNSSVAIRDHGAIGFDVRPDRWSLIPNGIDVGNYFPKYNDRLAVRRELEIPEDALLIGCVGRFVPEKGYSVFFEALVLVLQNVKPDVAARIRFLGAGNGVSAANDAFRNLAFNALSSDRLHLLEKRSDVPRLLRALDVFVLPSISEAFPNVLVEAMATALPCVTTDVGECRLATPAPEFVVKPKDASHLAACIIRLLEMSETERAVLGTANQRHVLDNFLLSTMIARFDSLFKEAAAPRP